MAGPQNVSVSASPTPYLLSAKADFRFILVGGVLLSLLLIVISFYDLGFLFVALSFSVMVDFPHVLHTYLRIGLDRAEYERYAAPIKFGFLAIAATCGVLMAFGQLTILLAIWVYWQPYHVIKQHHGISSLYMVKGGYRGDRRWLRWLLFAGCVAPILYRAATTGLTFGHYELFGRVLPFSGMHVPTPPIPLALVAGVYAVALVSAGGVALQAARRQAPPWPALLLVGLAVGTYNLAYLLVQDLYVSILAATAVHSLQYHAICYLFIRGKHGRRAPDKPDLPRPLGLRILAAISRDNGLTLYLGILLAAGALLASTEFMWLGLLPFIVVLHHFFIDSVIWKGNRHPELGTFMRLRPAAAA